MVHGNPVANAYGIEFEGEPSGTQYTRLNGIGDFIQMFMAGDYIVEAIDNTYERLAEVPAANAYRP
jgi:hypothetical protein